MMLGLLALALQLTTSANMALKEQYYNQLAREAAESGIMRLALWFPATAVPATLAALLLAPARTLAEEHEPLCALLMLFPVC